MKHLPLEPTLSSQLAHDHHQEVSSAQAEQCLPLVPTEARDYLRRLVKKTRRKSMMRYVARALLDNDVARLNHYFKAMLAILADTDERRWAERAIAVIALGFAPLTQQEASIASLPLIAILNNQQLSRRKRLGKRMASMGRRVMGIGGLAISCIIMAYIVFSEPYSPLESNIIGFLCGLTAFYAVAACLIIAPSSLVIDAERSTRLRSFAATTLGQWGFLNGLGALAAGASDPNVAVSRAALLALRPLLPRLTPEHYGQCGSETVPSLCRVLQRAIVDVNIPVTMEILIALEKVGDGRVVEVVEWMLREKKTGKFDVKNTNRWGVDREAESAMREQAEKMLPILLERKQQENAHRTLLRASQNSDSKPETLLRAAQPTLEHDPQQLLRPGVAED